MRVDHLPNKRDATGAGRYPGPRYGMRGLMSSSYYAREQLAQRGGTREREGRGPQAKGGATLARMARACRTAATPVLCVACVVWWPVVGASPSRTGGRRSRCGATGQRLDPPVVFVSLSGEWGGCRSARAVCAERCWRPGTTRTVAGPTAQDPRMLITTLSSEVRGQRCTRPYPWTVSHRESNFNSFLGSSTATQVSSSACARLVVFQGKQRQGRKALPLDPYCRARSAGGRVKLTCMHAYHKYSKSGETRDLLTTSPKRVAHSRLILVSGSAAFVVPHPPQTRTV